MTKHIREEVRSALRAHVADIEALIDACDLDEAGTASIPDEAARAGAFIYEMAFSMDACLERVLGKTAGNVGVSADELDGCDNAVRQAIDGYLDQYELQSDAASVAAHRLRYAKAVKAAVYARPLRAQLAASRAAKVA